MAVTISTLRSGQRPRRVRSWLFFAFASVALFAHALLASFDLVDLAAMFEVLTLALFALGVVLLYGADREQLRSIETHAERDATTGLLNRRAFRELQSEAELAPLLARLAGDEDHYRVTLGLLEATQTMPELADAQRELWADWRAAGHCGAACWCVEYRRHRHECRAAAQRD